MNVDEDELIGQPLTEVPERDPTDESCMGRRTETRDGDTVFAGYCGAWPGKGTDHVGEGRCDRHGGASGGAPVGNGNAEGNAGGAPEGNTNAEKNAGGAPEGNDNAEGNNGGAAPEENLNASTHALHVASNKFYQQVIDDELRTLCDRFYKSYVKKFREVNGEPIAGTEQRLSEIAVNHVKIIHSDNWAADRPDSIDTGNALIAEETRVKASQHEAHTETRYSESPVVKIQQRLRKEDRKWLKEYGLFGVDAIDVNVDGQVEHEHGLDEDTEELIRDLSEDLKA